MADRPEYCEHGNLHCDEQECRNRRNAFNASRSLPLGSSQVAVAGSSVAELPDTGSPSLTPDDALDAAEEDMTFREIIIEWLLDTFHLQPDRKIEGLVIKKASGSDKKDKGGDGGNEGNGDSGKQKN